MTFTDEQPFLDAIFDRYHEDAPRLVYADYLDDSGEHARAELVRVQVALARLSDDHPRKPALVDRQDELIAANSARWGAHVAHLGARLSFRRGVADSVFMYAGSLLSDGEELFRSARVRRLRLLEAAAVMPKLTHSPLLSHIRELDLCTNELGNTGVALLIQSRHLNDLEELDLAANWIDDDGVAILARAGCLAKLGTLALNDNDKITATGVAAIAESPFLGGLYSLDLSGNDLGEEAIHILTSSKNLARLHTIRLARNPIGDSGVTALVNSELFRRMLVHSSRLELRGNAIGPASSAAIAASPELARCTVLDLSGNYLGDHGLTAIMASPYLDKLHTLKLAGNQITDAGIVALRPVLGSLFRKLRVLDLGRNRLTRYGIGLLQSARGESGTILDVTENIQATVVGEAPVQLGEIVPEVLRDLTDAAQAAALKRRVAHPAARAMNHPHPPG